MKKSLLMLTVLAVSMAFVGAAFAADPAACGPAVGKTAFKLGKGKVADPKCVTVPVKQCVSMPGGPYTILEKPVTVTTMVQTDVYRDLCKGKAKGKEKLCGPCAPEIKWSCEWKTSVMCGKVSVPKKTTEMKKYVKPVDCVPVPPEPPSCM